MQTNTDNTRTEHNGEASSLHRVEYRLQHDEDVGVILRAVDFLNVKLPDAVQEAERMPNEKYGDVPDPGHPTNTTTVQSERKSIGKSTTTTSGKRTSSFAQCVQPP